MSNCDEYTCPFISDKCDEPDTLAIIQQFRKVYEDKLKEIDKEGCSDSLQLKLKIQEKWIDNLTEQTEMMARVVKELEVEAAERVQMLEDKLKRSSECACEVMRRYQMYDFQFNSDDYFQRIGCLENDVKNLLEFIRRVREDNRWSIDGLIFYEVDHRDLFGKDKQDCKCNTEMLPIDGEIGRGEEEVSRDNQDEVIERLRKEIDYLRSIGNSEELLEKLKKQNEQYDELKQNMIDMRQALTEEVACKHDLILLLKKDIQQLEERCVQTDKQTAFKDDIIKELRKEIKQLKQQKISVETCEKQKKLCNCDEAFKKLEKDHQLEVSKLQTMITELRNQLQDKNNNEVKKCESDISCPCPDSKLVQTADCYNEWKKKEKSLKDEIEKRQAEIDRLKEKCKQLEKNLANAKEQTENLQHAVDLYLNSINVLEASEERSKLEIEQQRMTIANLQEALVNVKHELEEIKGRNQQDVSVGWAARWFGNYKTNTKSVHDV